EPELEDLPQLRRQATEGFGQVEGLLRGNFVPSVSKCFVQLKRRRLMTKSQLFVGLLLVAVLVIFAPASHAQTNCQSSGSTINCNVIAVGSSAIFPSAAIAAVSADPTRGNPPLCGGGASTGV